MATHLFERVEVVLDVEEVGPPVVLAVVPERAEARVPDRSSPRVDDERRVQHHHHGEGGRQTHVAVRVEERRAEGALPVHLLVEDVRRQQPAQHEERVHGQSPVEDVQARPVPQRLQTSTLSFHFLCITSFLFVNVIISVTLSSLYLLYLPSFPCSLFPSSNNTFSFPDILVFVIYL